MQPHILIVDDEPHVVFFLHQMLKSIKPDYVVSTAQTGGEALRLARRDLLDVVIIDNRLKDTDGIALVSALKRLDRTLPVVMITAGQPPENHSDILCFLQKPFSIAQLISVIDEILDDTLSSADSGDGMTWRKDHQPQESGYHRRSWGW